MEVAVLVIAGVLIGGAWSAPTPNEAAPDLLLQPPLQVVSGSVPVTYISKYHAQDELGQVNYGFSHPGQAKDEVRDAMGNVAGVYTYIDDDNKLIRVEYTAGKDGFQVRSNNLPEGVSDTPEVLAAKLQFVEAYNAAALAAASAADDAIEGTSESVDTKTINIAVPVSVIQSPVKDTPEVIAAKLQFVEAYNAAALAAAIAPDDPVETSVDIGAKTAIVQNHNPTRDTPEVIAAKLRFLEAYNTAALAAANVDNAVSESTSRAVVTYASHAVQDTPEVIAAKLQFVEAYNAAAIASALAPDDDITPVTDYQSADEPVTDLKGLYAEENEVTILPYEEEENSEATTIFPGKIQDSIQESSQTRTFHVLKPIRVTEPPITEGGIPVSAVRFPQAHSYGAVPPPQTLSVEKPVVSAQNEHLLVPQLGDHVPVVGVPVTYVSRHHAQDELGQVDYGFSHPGQAKHELRDASGNVAGVYTYTDEENKVIRVEYTAGKDGFQVRSNNLPEAVRDTPEVMAAKLMFVEAYNAAALAAAAAPDQEDSVSLRTVDSLPLILQNPVKDTPEVIAAKLQFVDSYNAAALAAARAPDDPIDISTDTGPVIRTHVNTNPIQDSPEVIAAKLQFVEAYNAAALDAARVIDNPLGEDGKKIVVVYATPVIQDTPEVIAAKLQFVEAYNAAAIAAAQAPDDVIPQEVPEVNHEYENSNILLPTVLSESLGLTIVENDISEPIGEVYQAAEVSQTSNTLTPPYVPTSQDSGVLPNAPSVSVFQAHGQIPLVAISPVQSPYVVAPPVQNPTLVVAQAQDPVVAAPSVQNPALAFPSAQNPVLTASPIQSPVLTASPIQSPVVAVPSAQSPLVAVPVTHIYRHHAQDELGQVNYGFSHPGQVKNEIRDASGNVAGIYSYVDSDNKVIHVEYTAGENGFQVKSNNLPVAALDTPEVLAAKLQFVEAYNAAALAAASDDDDGTAHASDDINASNNTPLVLHNPVRDTPEVLAAKLKFAEDYNAAAVAAANAPDDLVISLFDSDMTILPIVNPNPVRDTPEVIAAKLQFVESYNAAAIAAATIDNAKSRDTSRAVLTYASHSVQDTPEVIAAKLQFVEAYNAAAMAAALAPDDETQEENTTHTPDENAVTRLFDMDEEIPQNQNTRDTIAEDIQDILLTDNPEDLNNGELPEVSQSLEDQPLVNTAVKDQYTIAYSTTPGFSQYSSYLPGSAVVSPFLFTNPLPFGIYGLPTTLASTHNSLPKMYIKEIPYSPYILRGPMASENGDSLQHIPMYAPAYTY